ncbi:MAG: CHRD domain-containing protein [Bdellovibrionota bacterium]
MFRSLLLLILSCLFCASAALAQTVYEVRVVDHRYSPSSLTVNEGDTVRWVWDNDFHDVISGNLFAPDGAFRSAVLNKGSTFEVLFDRTLLKSFARSGNQYKYYCEPHGAMGMTGAVTVTRVAKNYQAALQNWQMVPPSSASSNGNCTLQLNSTETQLTWSCTHNAPRATSFSIRRGALGSSGSAICTVNGSSVNGSRCNLSSTDADDLVAGNLYVQLTSSDFPSGELRGQIVATGGSYPVSGQILRQSGKGVSDVTVSDGSRSAMSDSQGNFTITGVPNGVYKLSAAKSGFDLVPESSVTPFMVNGGSVSGRFFRASRTPGIGLKSPVKVLWNGFLRMINILEIINKGNVDMPVTVSLYDIAGNRVHQRPVVIRANGQFDVIVNDLPGFQADSYGIVSLEFDASFQSALDGRMTNYRPAPGGAAYEFVFAVPFMAPLANDSAVSFNTFQPSRNPAEAALPVAQWLSLVNLDSNATHTYTVSRYDQAGTLLRQDVYAIPPNGRTDIEGGHVLPGPSTVGLHLVHPDDPTAPYLAQLYRYSPGLSGTYNFAFPLLAKGGSGEIQYAPISTLNNGENWLELANVLAVPVSVTLEYYNQPGTLLRRDTVNLPPHAQQHFFAGALLKPGESGSVHIIPNSSSSIVGQSMYYFRNAFGTVTGMYGSGIRESAGSSFFGSYNLFLQMSNSLRISNTLDTANPVTVTIFSDIGVPNTRVIELAPHQTVDLRVEDPQYGTKLDSYGQIAISSQTSDSLLLEVVRLRLMPKTTDIDFALPTTVR